MEEKLKPFIEEYSDDFYESIEDILKVLSFLVCVHNASKTFPPLLLA